MKILNMLVAALLLVGVGCGNQMSDTTGQHVLRKESDQWQSSANSFVPCDLQPTGFCYGDPNVCNPYCVGTGLCNCGGTLECCIEACEGLCGPYPTPFP